MAEIPDDIFTTAPRGTVKDERIAIITADGTEDQEFFYPYYRFIEEGYQVDVLTPKGGSFKGKNGSGLKETMAIADADPYAYALLYIPGGKAPAALKKEDEAVQFVKEFCASGKPIGAICHGPQLLAKAGVIAGKQISAYPECQEEVEEAGARFVNEACVVDSQFITGRWPADLPFQTAGMLQALGVKSAQQKRAA